MSLPVSMSFDSFRRVETRSFGVRWSDMLTINLSPFQPGKGYDNFCKGNVFMCSDEKNYDQFASCFDAVNCAMHDQMKVAHTGNCQELFINQMIPHHQNAVNMAKILLKFT